MRYLYLLLILFFTACAGIPEGIKPIENFDVNKYLGTWYEIARFDHKFERGLDNITATYSKKDEEAIKVINKGYDYTKKEWKEAEGVAYFIDKPTTGMLKVSFFRPFYGGYNIIDIDQENYQYALICGNDRSYLWILAREKKLEESMLEKLVAKAKELGFETDKLIYVNQDMN